MSKRPCLEPFVSLTVTGPGVVTPCCAYNGKLAEASEVSDFADYFSSNPELEALRAKELSGQWQLPGCENCLHAGSSSRKDMFADWMASRGLDVTPPSPPKLLHLCLDFSNRCNMTCLMCSSEYSTSWRKHDASFLKKHSNGMRPLAPAWSLRKEQVARLLDLMDTVKILEIRGGEPLLDPHFDFFLSGVLEKQIPDLEITVITNFSHANEKNIALLSRMKGGSIDISVDGTGRTYDWIRGYPFQDIEAKLLRFLPRLREQNINFNYTTSFYNLDQIETFYNWVHKLHQATKTPLSINYGLIAMTPDYVNPRLATSKIHEGLRQIERIIEDPYRMTFDHSFKRGLQMLKDYLLLGPIEDEELIERHRLWHRHLVEIRGWDFGTELITARGSDTSPPAFFL